MERSDERLTVEASICDDILYPTIVRYFFKGQDLTTFELLHALPYQ